MTCVSGRTHSREALLATLSLQPRVSISLIREEQDPLVLEDRHSFLNQAALGNGTYSFNYRLLIRSAQIFAGAKQIAG